MRVDIDVRKLQNMRLSRDYFAFILFMLQENLAEAPIIPQLRELDVVPEDNNVAMVVDVNIGGVVMDVVDLLLKG